MWPSSRRCTPPAAATSRSLSAADLCSKPAIIVTGLSDALVPVNNNARIHVAKHKLVEGAVSKLSHVEVTNAQHFDNFIPPSGLDTRFVPVHIDFVRAMEAMHAHLSNGSALPVFKRTRR